MKNTVRSPFVLLFFCLVNCMPEVDIEKEKAVLLQADQQWATAAKAGDIEKTGSFWASDAINFFPGAPPAVGKEAILELVKRNRSRPGFSLSWEPAAATVSKSGELGYTYGTFQMTYTSAGDKPKWKEGNYVCIWKKTGGSWKCIVESTVFGPSRPDANEDAERPDFDINWEMKKGDAPSSVGLEHAFVDVKPAPNDWSVR